MTPALVNEEFGSSSRNLSPLMGDPSEQGAMAALETFYYALNSADLGALAFVWSNHELAQLNNPVGGILRSGEEVVSLYRRIFEGQMNVQVTFHDAVRYLAPEYAVFAGRETGTYVDASGSVSPVRIRTSRFFEFDTDLGRWQQMHHHGSIDDPAGLAAYQLAAGSAL